MRVAKDERAIWQRRFLEHVIRDESDYARHVDYLHWNPMKHGVVEKVTGCPIPAFIVMCGLGFTQKIG